MAVTALAAAARVPVFVALGGGARGAVDGVLAGARLRRVASPRHATVLLVVGAMPEPMATPLARVHDQLPRPRATVWWGGPPDGEVLPGARVLAPTAGADEVAAAIAEQHRAVVTGTLPSAPDLLPDSPPNPWKGVGPHGQGGEGMMMGNPYGRPMAMTADDRDGLALDQLWLRLGPFLPGFPPGLSLRVAMQGDVLQDVEVGENPFASGAPLHGAAIDVPSSPDVPVGSVVSVAGAERLRAARLLGAVATLLDVQSLPARAERARRASRRLQAVTTAGDLEAVAGSVTRLTARLRRGRLLRASLRGVGATASPQVRQLLAGPDARAAGDGRDRRSRDPAYAELGFAPLRHDTGDAWARLCQRLAEIEQSLDLAARAGDRVAGVSGDGTTLTGPEFTEPGVLAHLLPGTEMGDAIATVASLGLDLDAAVRSPAGAGAGA